MLRAPRSRIPDGYEGGLARSILAGGPSARIAAMKLLEYSDPPTLDAAVGVMAAQGTVTVEAFDCLADTWESYRNLKHLSWD